MPAATRTRSLSRELKRTMSEKVVSEKAVAAKPDPEALVAEMRQLAAIAVAELQQLRAELQQAAAVASKPGPQLPL